MARLENKRVKLAKGTRVEVPKEVEEKASPELTREERIRAIAESEWAQEWATGLCSFVEGVPEEKVSPRCKHRLSRTLAREVI